MIELLRKLMLTSILSLVAPGSAGQVVVGLLIAFAALLLNLRLKPFADDTLNFINQARGATRVAARSGQIMRLARSPRRRRHSWTCSFFSWSHVRAPFDLHGSHFCAHAATLRSQSFSR